MTGSPDTLIMPFAPGGSLSRWRDLGRLDREKQFLGALAGVVGHILFIAQDGPDDLEIARDLTAELGVSIDAISVASPDPELGKNRDLAERVLARLETAHSVVIQTMQLADGGISSRIVGPLRRVGIRAGLVARGGFIGSRVQAAAEGPHAFSSLTAGADEQALCRLAQIVAGASESMLDELAWRHGINPARQRVIPHFVLEEDEPATASQREPGLILAVGGLEPRRGLDTIIAAVARLPESVRASCRVEIIGEGPEREALKALAEAEGVRLSLPGRVPHDDVRARMRRCSVFVHASPVRCQSRTVLEAMSNGCSVVVTDTPELDGLVENASTGIRVKPTPEAFGFAIESMMGDADWRDMLGSAAAFRIRSACALNRVVDLTRRTYHDALELAPAAVPGRARRAG